MNAKLIGLSIDQVFSHIKWVEWIQENLNTEIRFPIIADHGAVGKKLGMIHPGKSSNTVRAFFIVDAEGIIRLIIYYPQEIGRNMDEIVRAVKALQLADKEKVAIPDNWPENELIGDHVIIPPAKDVKTAKERLKSSEFECYDWWLCHKKL
jgi:peroxiredoxin (alkyl hydroperoxide reductase subunit C)